MKPDYSKRDYLLPKGCKDLVDVLNLQPQKPVSQPLRPQPLTFAPIAVVTGELLIPAPMTVLRLAGLLRKKPIRLVLDLMELGIFSPITAELDFDTVAGIVRRYGYIAKKPA